MERSLRKIVGTLAAIFASSAAFAADIGALNKKEPDATFTSSKTIFEIERCIIEIDALGVPGVYRQPDRPDKTQIAYSIGTGIPLLIALFQTANGSRIEIRRTKIVFSKPDLPPMLTSCF